MTMFGGNDKGPGFRARVRDWSARHPLTVLSIGLIVLGWLLIYEVVRIVDARRTVTHDWATGLLTGILAGVVLTGVMTLLARRSRKTHKLGALAVLILVAALSVLVTFRLTASVLRPTIWIEVAGMAYVAVFAAVTIYLIGWAAQLYWRRRRMLRAGVAGQPGQLPADRLEH